MKTQPRSSKHTLLCIAVVSIVLGSLYFGALMRSLGGFNDPKADFKNYQAYIVQHNCEREVHGEKVFFRCTNGAWSERDLNDVANGRVPG